jgi:hypothetical protein
LRKFAPGAEIHFERVAVTKEQITALNLPTRPTKKSVAAPTSNARFSLEALWLLGCLICSDWKTAMKGLGGAVLLGAVLFVSPAHAILLVPL